MRVEGRVKEDWETTNPHNHIPRTASVNVRRSLSKATEGQRYVQRISSIVQVHRPGPSGGGCGLRSRDLLCARQVRNGSVLGKRDLTAQLPCSTTRDANK